MNRMHFRMFVLLQIALCCGGVRDACSAEEASARNIASCTVAVRWRTAALPDCRPRTSGDSVTRLRRNFAHVETHHTGLSAEVYGRCAGPAGYRRLLDSGEISTWSRRRDRFTISRGWLQIDKARVVGHDIGLMVAYAYATQFPEGNGEVSGDGCVSSRRARMGTDLQ